MNRTAITASVLAFGLGVAATLGAQQFAASHGNVSQPYAGQEDRQVSSLSDQDIQDLKAGKGWGLAKPAELNGYPGPAHILELEQKLELSAEQLSQITIAFESMQAKAKQLGARLVEAESALDALFREKKANEASLKQQLAIAEKVRSDLRAAHLQAHLQVTPLLNDEQIAKYAEFRGYGNGHAGHGGH